MSFLINKKQGVNMQEKKAKMSLNKPRKQKTDRKKSNLDTIISELDNMGYDYIEGYISNKKDKIKAVHRKCGRERSTRFTAFSVQECRYCKRQDADGKYQKSISSNEIVKILQLHSEGKNNVEIGNKVGFSNSTIRNVLLRNGLKSNIPKTKLVEVACQACGAVFTPKYHNRDKACSPACVSELISRSKLKYTQNDIENVMKYKKRKFTNDEISQITKVNVNKIKEIVKEKEMTLSLKDAQANAYRKKLNKNPNCMEEMRETRMKFSTEEFEKKVNELIEQLKDENNKYSSAFLSAKIGLNPKSTSGILRHRGYDDLIKPTKTSVGEEQVADLIREFINKDIEIIRGDRTILKPKELDIYIPELNLAIEYCGLYWHNEDSPQPRGRNYHYEKMKACQEQGVRLITIFEDEWLNRREQVSGFLMSVLGKAEKRYFARKCEVKEVDKAIARKFLNDYHIQGKTTCKIAFGLYYNDELLGVTTGNVHHRQKGDKAPFVLNRLVFKKGVLVVGGASKLLKHLMKYAKNEGFKELISWSDNRWSQGNVYEKTGFTLVEELKPDYSYVTSELTRQSKQSNKKKLLLKKGAVGSMANTEKELAKSIGYSRIWDCGKQRWSIDL